MAYILDKVWVDYPSLHVIQSYSGLRGAVAFSLALSRVNDEPSLQTSHDINIQTEAAVRKAMFTAVTVLVLFTVFVQVAGDKGRGGGRVGGIICGVSVHYT